MKKFYDTSALLEKTNSLFKDDEEIIISTTVLEELENIKTSNKKDEHIKKSAKKIIRLLNENKDKYEVIIFSKLMLKPLVKKGISLDTYDMNILAAVVYCDTHLYPDNVMFITNDLSLQNIANLFLGEDSISEVQSESVEDLYCGYLSVLLSETEMAYFYENINENIFNLLTNQYLYIKDTDGILVDALCWNGKTHRKLKYNTFNSTMFGAIKPKKNDIYQASAFDSLNNNIITMLKGKAGSGKSILATSFLMHKLEKDEIDKIIIFCNTVATKNSARLGFYPGSRDEKLLDSQIGNFLGSKFGSKMIVEKMIADEKLLLLPMSDIRGFDTNGMRAGIYITEAQNMDISLMKLAMQRVGEDSLVIIDGDCATQVDDTAFAGSNNGMKRLSQVFRGQPFYGEVELGIIHRSKIAAVADLM